MSLTIIQYPAFPTSTGFNQIMPAYNPIVFTLNSTNKAQCSFQYICDVYVDGTFITRLKTFPVGSNGYGEFKVQEVLADLLSYDLQKNLYGSSLFALNPNSFISYELEFGEEYDSSAQCDSGTVVYPALLSSNTIVSFKAFNGALQYREWLDWNGGDRTTTDVTTKFLTDFPERGLICSGDQMVFNIFMSSLNSPQLRVKTYNSAGTLLGTYLYNCSLSVTLDMISVGVGPENLNNSTLASGTQPVITSNVSYYTVQLVDTGAAIVRSELKRIDLDYRELKWSHHRLWFLNHYGAFDSYTFTLKDSFSTDISRTEFNKVYGEIVSLSPGYTWSYNVGDRGRTTLQVNGQDSMVYQSNWLTEAESLWMKELFLSIEAYETLTNERECFCGLLYGHVESYERPYFFISITVTGEYETGDSIYIDFGINNPFSSLSGVYTILSFVNGVITIDIGQDCVEVDFTCISLGSYDYCGVIMASGFVSEFDPLIIKSRAYSEKTKNKIKNINHLIELDKAYPINRQRN